MTPRTQFVLTWFAGNGALGIGANWCFRTAAGLFTILRQRNTMRRCNWLTVSILAALCVAFYLGWLNDRAEFCS